jgi:hypothetical protein
LRKDQQTINALSDKAFTLSQAHSAETTKGLQESERLKFKYEQEYFALKQKYDQIYSKATFHTDEQSTLKENRTRLRALQGIPPPPEAPAVPVTEHSIQLLLVDCKAILQLPGAVSTKA